VVRRHRYDWWDVAVAGVAAVAVKVSAVKAAVQGTTAKTGILWQLRRVLLMGLGVGLGVAFISYVTTHGVGAALSGAGAAATAVAVHTGLWVCKAVRRVGAGVNSCGPTRTLDPNN
jgi:hypothetical protein